VLDLHVDIDLDESLLPVLGVSELQLTDSTDRSHILGQLLSHDSALLVAVEVLVLGDVTDPLHASLALRHHLRAGSVVVLAGQVDN
jgi:hypothetical protein